jgi:hypothetical protein
MSTPIEELWKSVEYEEEEAIESKSQQLKESLLAIKINKTGGQTDVIISLIHILISLVRLESLPLIKIIIAGCFKLINKA